MLQGCRSGFLKPRHSAGAYSVRLYLYQKIGGRWVYRGRIAARNGNYSWYTKYSASVRLWSRGSWRIRAYHGDGDHAGTWTAPRYVTVK